MHLQGIKERALRLWKRALSESCQVKRKKLLQNYRELCSQYGAHKKWVKNL